MGNQNLIWHPTVVSKLDRHRLNNHKSCVIWFTGFSGSGKSTIANELDAQLYLLGIRSYLLDGDNVRHGLNKDLGFSSEDRHENIRRIGEVAKLFVLSGQIVMTAFISPFKQDREQIRNLFEEGEYIEVFINCPFEICEHRDPKGLYKKARNGEIQDFTGIDSPYEPPNNPELIINTDQFTVKEAVEVILEYLRGRGIL
ncbi:adenylyl-sulfate kinase [Pseudogracilibacillus sp. SE30717A]|uniref:adenylyl-sulfate kinase n=1 Tax=Pseudogracilibacillus sp. SE30717A TaxID=3098293 RepID=UPI00300E12CC